MNKSYSILFILFVHVVVITQLHAQTVFNKLDSSCRVLGNILPSNNSYYSLGSTYNACGSGTIVLNKYDHLGMINYIDTFSIDSVASYNGNFQLYNNKIYIFSTTNSVFPYTSSTANLQLTICDTSFNVQDSIIFGGNGQELSFDIGIFWNNIFLFGATDSYGSGLVDLYLTKLDTLGNLIWSKTYGTSNDEDARSFTQTADGKLILLGVKHIFSSDWDLNLVKVDPENGDIIWEKNIGDSFTDYPGEITALHDQSFIVYHNVANNSNTIGYIDKLDGNGNIVWRKPFPFNDLSSFSYGKAIENIDGTLLVNCAVKNSAGHMISRILKLSPLGDTIWTKEYFTNPNIPQYINDIKPTSDEGYIFSGGAVDSGMNQRAWLIKTNCNGEDGVQYPITGTICDQYDCTQFPIDAGFIPNKTHIDLAVESGVISFENTSNNTTSRVWNFGDGQMDYTNSLVTHTYGQPGQYNVELIVYHSMCSDTVIQTIEVVNSVGLESPYLDFGFKLYPNPSNGSFNVEFAINPVGSLRIFDMSGRIIMTKILDGSSSSFSFEDFTKGIYSLELHLKNGNVEYKRIVIN